jgi:hypothetical protein
MVVLTERDVERHEQPPKNAAEAGGDSAIGNG